MSTQGRPRFIVRGGEAGDTLSLTTFGFQVKSALSRPIYLHHIILLAATTVGNSAAVAQVSHRRTGGAALTPASNNTIGQIAIPAMSEGSGVRVSARNFKRSPSGFSPDPLLVIPGEEISISLLVQASSGTMVVMYHISLQPKQSGPFVRSSDIGNPYEITTPPDIDWLQDLTRLDFTGGTL